jgi:predicted dehydrogenase
VSYEQLSLLLRAVEETKCRIFAGYNRPFSPAIRELRARTRIVAGEGMTLGCFVAGHRLAADHWYRQPQEGTRVCGNIGHWLDLFVHVLSWRGLPERLDISVTWASEDERDDNVSISISSDRDDLLSLTLTSRSEPYEGINETIHFQHGETLCKIDDFRRMTVWQGAALFRRRFWPKDVGHEFAILQPLRQDVPRNWQEVVLSTLLMLHITDMVRAKTRVSSFTFAAELARLRSASEAA